MEAAHQAAQMDRRRVRTEFERRFTAESMASAYLAAYQLLLNRVTATRELMIELPLAPPTLAIAEAKYGPDHPDTLWPTTKANFAS